MPSTMPLVLALVDTLEQIVSIGKALPLQIHPNKELAQKLHREQPEKFPDPNHKPEIAVALSRFEAFIGWKPLRDISVLVAMARIVRAVSMRPV